MAKFKKGQSGNPDGRPKGSKNQITLLKEFLELQMREQLAPELGSIMAQAIELAKAGDRMMIKLILELSMSKGTTQDGSKAAEKVEINIMGPQPEVKKEEIVPSKSKSTDEVVH